MSALSPLKPHPDNPSPTKKWAPAHLSLLKVHPPPRFGKDTAPKRDILCAFHSRRRCLGPADLKKARKPVVNYVRGLLEKRRYESDYPTQPPRQPTPSEIRRARIPRGIRPRHHHRRSDAHLPCAGLRHPQRFDDTDAP